MPDDPSPAAPDFARLTSVSGSVEVVGPAGETAARRNQLLTADQTLRTVGEDSVAVVEFPDRTRIEIHPESIVRFGPEPTGELTRKLVLVQGRITAVTDGGRLVVAAGATEVKASRGSFALWSAGSGSARVESTAGDVQVSHGAPAEPVRLDPGHAAYVRDEQTPMRIDARWRIDSEPRARLDFQALDVGFTPDGEVVAVSAKQWTRWKPGTPDPGRTLFPPKVFNDGLAAWLTPNRRAVALCRIDDREERIVVRDLPSGAERGQIPVRVNDPRFLCVAPDASWVATAGGQKPNNRKARVWDVATAKERFAFDLDNSVSCLAASPDGRELAVGVSDLGRDTGNAVVVFDTTTDKRLFDLPTRRKLITALTFSSDGKYLAVGFNGAIQLWDVPGRELLRTLDGFERSVTRLAFSPMGDLLAVGTHDGQVWMWSTETGRRTQVIDTGTRGVRSLAFSADGKLLVTATNKAPVAVWVVSSTPPAGSEPDA
ncbi:MAG: hypothetical protein FJ304_27350 [Planctomycetes bacterium]|nr:hypothetical protein [Planctomycetota bacterium]